MVIFVCNLIIFMIFVYTSTSDKIMLGRCWCKISGFNRAVVEFVALLGYCTALIGSMLVMFRGKLFVLFQGSRSPRFFLECLNLEDGRRRLGKKLPTYTTQHPIRKNPCSQLFLTSTPAFQIKLNFSAQTQQFIIIIICFFRWEILTKPSFFKTAFYCFVLHNCYYYYFYFNFITLQIF